MSLGKTIVRLRTEKGIKQKDLAAQLGVHQRQLTRWEHDEARPRQKALENLARALDTSVEKLMGIWPSDPLVSLEDAELQQLVGELPKLAPYQRDALKVVIKDMLTRSRLEAALHA